MHVQEYYSTHMCIPLIILLSVYQFVADKKGLEKFRGKIFMILFVMDFA